MTSNTINNSTSFWNILIKQLTKEDIDFIKKNNTSEYYFGTQNKFIFNRFKFDAHDLVAYLQHINSSLCFKSVKLNDKSLNFFDKEEHTENISRFDTKKIDHEPECKIFKSFLLLLAHALRIDICYMNKNSNITKFTFKGRPRRSIDIISTFF